MSEKFRETPEQETRGNGYSMERTRIEAVESRPDLPEPLRRFDWPLELYGRGISNSKLGEMSVRYPKGDLPLSYVTAIHEMGHLRQHDLNSNLHQLEEQTHENLMNQETDAWERGWRRFTEANPERLEQLERIIHDSGNVKLKDIGSFARLYEYVRDNSLKLVGMQKVLFETKNKDRAFERLAEDVERSGWNDFLTEFKKLRIGQTVDTEQMDDDIRNVMRNVIEE